MVPKVPYYSTSIAVW